MYHMHGLLVYLMLLSLHGFAQWGPEEETMPERKNAVKLNLSSLPFNNYGIQYERALGPNLSAAAQLRYMPKATQGWWSWDIVPSLDFFGGGVGSTSLKQSLAIRGMPPRASCLTFTPEIRVYPKLPLRGFYIATYLRLRTIGAEYEGIPDYDSMGQVVRTIDLKGRMNSWAAGMLFGAHFNLGPAVSLDWFIIGLHYGTSSTRAEGLVNGNTMNASQQEFLRVNFGEELYFLRNRKSSSSPNSILITSKSHPLGLRGFGLNLGYRF